MSISYCVCFYDTTTLSSPFRLLTVQDYLYLLLLCLLFSVHLLLLSRLMILFRLYCLLRLWKLFLHLLLILPQTLSVLHFLFYLQVVLSEILLNLTLFRLHLHAFCFLLYLPYSLLCKTALQVFSIL